MTDKGERARQTSRRHYLIGLGLSTRPNSVATTKTRIEQAG